jgi:hypothetical protein
MEIHFMSTRHFFYGAATCALLTISSVAAAQTSPSQVTVPFSDPSRPGTVKVNILSGGISVRVGPGRDVIVTTTPAEHDAARERSRDQNRSRDTGADDPAAGLHRLTPPAGVNIEEENNIVTISAPVMFGRVNVAIQVPAATNLALRALNGGEVTVEGVNGSIEVNNINGSVRLTDVGGPVIAHAMNGKVVATLRQVAVGKPMSFTSFNGSVDVTLPASAKANLKLRSDRGDVYTDFDVQTSQAAAPRSAPGDGRHDDARSRDRSSYGTINGGGPDFDLRTFNGNVYLRKAK